MFDERFKIENDLSRLENILKTEYKNIPFDKGLPLFGKEINKIADKYNTTGEDIGNLLFLRLSRNKQ